MARDQFLEKTYLTKTKGLFEQEVEVRVYKSDPHSLKHDLSISLNIDDEEKLYANVLNVGYEGFDSIIEILKFDLNKVNQKDIGFALKAEQFRNKYFHLNGTETTFNYDDLRKISGLFAL